MTLPRPGRGDTLALATLLGALAAGFAPWIAMRRVFFQVDVAFMDHPLRVHAFEMLRAGRLPLWSDALLGGFPLFAEGQAAILYPPSWLYGLLAPEAALNAFVVGHFLLLASSTYLFLRGRSLPPEAAAFGALTLATSSFMLVEHVLMGFLGVAAWLPLLLWAGERAVRTGSRRRHALAAGVVALMLVAGDALGAILGCVAAVAWMFASCPERPMRRRILSAGGVLGLGGALAAVQLVPLWEFLGQSTRGAGEWSMRGAGFAVPVPMALTAAFPGFYGARLSEYVGPGVFEERLFFFVGWAGLLLAALGATLRPGRFWALLAAAGLFLGLDVFVPLSSFLWSLPPLHVFRWPGRALLWYALGASVLAALGMAATTRTSPGSKGWRLGMLAALGLVPILAFFAVGADAPVADGAPAAALVFTRRADVALFALSWSGLILGCWLRQRGRLGSRGLVALAFVVFGVGLARQPLPEGVPPRTYTTLPEVVPVLSEDLDRRARLLALSPWNAPRPPADAGSLRRAFGKLAANAHLRYGLRAVGQFDLEHTATLARSRRALAEPHAAVLELLGVAALVAPADAPPDPALTAGYRECHAGAVRVLCRERPLPRAFLVEAYDVVPSGPVALERLRADGSPRARVFLEEAPRWPAAAPPTPVPSRESVRLVEDEPGRVVLDVAGPRHALLVLADTWYPGWSATLNGEPVPILAADGFVRAVAVPAGRHELVFRYAPLSLLLGALISVVALALTSWLVVGAPGRVGGEPRSA